MNTLNTSSIREITTEEHQLIGVGGGINNPNGYIPMPFLPIPLPLPIPFPIPVPFPGFPE
jgi:hypothetical protein